MFRSIFILSVVASAFGQYHQDARCSKPATADAVDIQKMVGTWYEIERIPNENQNGECNTITFSINADTTGTMVNREVVNKTLVYRNATLTRTAADLTTGRFLATFTDNTTYNYYVLSTDYSNYTLLYSCRDVSANTSNVYAWKLSISSDLTNRSAEIMNGILSSSYPYLSNTTWKTIGHTDCKHNSGTAILVSPVLLLTAIYFVSKELF